jgi:tRNA(adenine34) deaminase
MRLALDQTELALSQNNLPIGAMIVHQGQVIASAHNLVESESSDLNHAEMLAIRRVENFLFKHKGQCEIYSTLEPCMMCMGAIYQFRFKALFFAAHDKKAGHSKPCEHTSLFFQKRDVRVESGLLAQESVDLLRKYVEQTGRRQHLIGSWCLSSSGLSSGS